MKTATSIEATRDYKHTDLGWVAPDGWVEALDPPRTQAEEELIARCPDCSKLAFDLYLALETLDWCHCN